MKKTKGDGTDLCCLIKPMRICTECKTGLCSSHWYDDLREKQDLRPLQQAYSPKGEIGVGYCPKGCEGTFSSIPLNDER